MASARPDLYLRACRQFVRDSNITGVPVQVKAIFRQIRFPCYALSKGAAGTIQVVLQHGFAERFGFPKLQRTLKDASVVVAQVAAKAIEAISQKQ